MKRLLGVLMIILVPVLSWAQKEIDGNSPSLRERLFFGGGLGFGAGTNGSGYHYNYISLNPVTGLMLNPTMSAGIGISYLRLGYPDLGTSYIQYGLSPFVRYNIKPLFFQVEYDIINSPIIQSTGLYSETQRRSFNRFLVGIGYAMPIGSKGRSKINILGMYDLLYQQPSVFNSPYVIRVYFTF